MIEIYTLYKAYDAAGEPVYFGATSHLGARLADHKRERSWWREIAEIKLEHFDTLEEVLEAEKSAIQIEGPRHNLTYLAEPTWAMKPRRPRGQSGVYQRADGLWVGSVEISPGRNGQRRQKRVASKDRAVAEQKLAALRQQLETPA